MRIQVQCYIAPHSHTHPYLEHHASAEMHVASDSEMVELEYVWNALEATLEVIDLGKCVKCFN